MPLAFSEPMTPAPHLASPNGGLPSSVLWAQLMLKDRLRAGDVVVDATMGNGHDTLFLTQCVAPGGRVFAFDVQETALIETRKRVPEDMTTLIHAGHETMRTHVPQELHGQISAVMFNLGYLPGTDKALITRTETTMIAVSEALELLRAACSRWSFIPGTRVALTKGAAWPSGPPRLMRDATRYSTSGR